MIKNETEINKPSIAPYNLQRVTITKVYFFHNQNSAFFFFLCNNITELEAAFETNP